MWKDYQPPTLPTTVPIKTKEFTAKVLWYNFVVYCSISVPVPTSVIVYCRMFNLLRTKHQYNGFAIHEQYYNNNSHMLWAMKLE